MRPEFVGSVAGILNVAYGYASGADSSPPAQDTNLPPLVVRRSAATPPPDRLRVRRSDANFEALFAVFITNEGEISPGDIQRRLN